MVKGRLKTTTILLILAVFSAIWGIWGYSLTGIHNVTTYSYTALILFWVYSLKDEIPDTYVRRIMSLGGYLLTLLFVLRYIKYNLVRIHTFPHRLMWYGYYIPLLVTPLLSFMLSLSIGNRDRLKHRKFFLLLQIICALLVVLVLTNDLHSLVIKIWYENEEEYSRMGPLYFLIIGWYVVLMLSSFVIMYRKCRLSSYRKYWKIPFVVELIGGILWLWYYIICHGSSPKLGGYSLYNIQEIYVLLFIGFWEALIVIGLIPSVSLAKDRAWISEGILDAVGKEISEIKRLLAAIDSLDEESFKKTLARICLFGVYIKRRANLELISSDTGTCSTKELSLSIREALDYFAFSNISIGFEESGEGIEVPTLLITCAYDLLKNITTRSESACYVKLVTDSTKENVSFKMTVESDMVLKGDVEATNTNAAGSSLLADTQLLEALGAKLLLHAEDDTWICNLTATYPVYRKREHSLMNFGKAAEHSLFLITPYLSLEKEALNAKTHIHDSLGRCLIMSRSYLLDQKLISADAIISEWVRFLDRMSNNTMDLPYSDEDRDLFYLIDEARIMGLDVIITGAIPEDESFMSILKDALNVQMTNVIKHAEGKKLFVRISSDEDTYAISLTNDGRPPAKEISAGTGLKNLRQHVLALRGNMEIRWKEGFELLITIPAAFKTTL